jgi:hypothetical protein
MMIELASYAPNVLELLKKLGPNTTELLSKAPSRGSSTSRPIRRTPHITRSDSS